MDFSEALKELKAGKAVTNCNWNGKGMYIVMMPGYPDGIALNEISCKAHHIQHGCPESYIPVGPYITMLDATGTLVPWTPSQLDMFSNDWQIKTLDEIEYR